MSKRWCVLDLSLVVTRVVVEVYVSSVYPRNTEIGGDSLHLQVRFTARTNFVCRLNPCSHIGVLMPDYFQGLISKILSV